MVVVMVVVVVVTVVAVVVLRAHARAFVCEGLDCGICGVSVGYRADEGKGHFDGPSESKS